MSSLTILMSSPFKKKDSSPTALLEDCFDSSTIILKLNLTRRLMRDRRGKGSI